MKSTLFPLLTVALLATLSLIGSTHLRAAGSQSPLASTLRKDYYINKLREPSLDFSTKLSYLDSLDKMVPLAPGELMKEKTDIYLSSGHYPEAVETLTSILHDGNLPTDSLLFALYNLAYARQALGNYEMALDDIFRIKTTEKPDTLLSYDIYSDFLLARIYRIAGRYAESDTILARAERLIPVIEKDSAERYSLMYKWQLERASAFLDSRNYDEALTALNKASQFNMDKESASLVHMGMAELYHHIGEAGIAEDYYRTFIDETPSSINRLYALNNFSVFLIDNKRYREARELCLEQIAYADRNGISHVKASLYQNLADALYGMEDYKGAYEAHKTFYSLMDSLLYSVSPRITHDYEERMNLYRASGPTDSQSHYGLWIILLAILSVLLLAGLIGMFLIYRRKRSELKDDTSVTDSDTLPSDTEAINRECVSLSLQLAEMNSVLEQVYDIALDPSKSATERRTELNNLRTAHSANQNFWETFQLSFEKLNPRFVRNLREKHPDLTRGEIRMCSFIVMGLTTKEIALITCRSVRTVESMKYRLSKKLDSPAGTSLESYLRLLMQ